MRITPMSGAGPALASLMAELAGEPAVAWEGGKRVEHRALARGPVMRFPSGELPTFRAAGCEPAMLRASLGAGDVAFYVTLAPTFASRVLRLVAPLLPTPLWRWGPVKKLTALWLTFLRAFLLRRRAAPIEIAVTARTADGRTAHRTLRVEDGMIATADAIAAALARVVAPPPAQRPRGVVLPDELASGQPSPPAAAGLPVPLPHAQEQVRGAERAR